MAYDENGNWYFNPQIDEEDADLYRDELKRQQVREVVKAQQKQNQEANDFNKMWQATLESEGLDVQTYTELYNQDPDAAKAALKDAMQHVARNVKKGRQPQTPQAQAPQMPGVKQPQQPDKQQTLEAMREKARKGPLSENDELDIIGALFPDML